jgi:hypothetical protein
MRKLFLTSIAALFLATGANAAPKGDVSTRWFLEAYDKMLPEHRKHVEDMLSWMQLGLLWANTLLKDRGQPLIYCQPDRLTVTGPMILDMMRKGVRDNPKWSEVPAELVIVTALQRTFPCPSSMPNQ